MKLIRTRVFFGCAVLFYVWLVSAARVSAYETRLYWTDPQSDKIQSARLDGSDVRDVIVGGGDPYSLDIDQAAQKMYWAANAAGEIRRANLDGTEVETLVTGLSYPLGVAVDPAGGKVYFTNQHAGTVGRANLDGTASELLITGRKYTGFLSVDHANQKLYWGDTVDGLQWGIRRSNLDGSAFGTLTNALSPHQIDFDADAEEVYWADRAWGAVFKIDMDGTDREIAMYLGGGTNGLALDLVAGKAYWTDDINNRIGRTNLDGTNTEILVTGPPYPSSIKFAVVVPEPGSCLLATAGLTALVFTASGAAGKVPKRRIGRRLESVAPTDFS